MKNIDFDSSTAERLGGLLGQRCASVCMRLLCHRVLSLGGPASRAREARLQA